MVDLRKEISMIISDELIEPACLEKEFSLRDGADHGAGHWRRGVCFIATVFFAAPF